MIEVEIRTFVSDTKFQELLHYLSEYGEKLEHTRQITHYLDHPIDTRIQISTRAGKLWQKLGRMHDACRDELEIEMSSSGAATAATIFSNLGYGWKVSWYRERRTYQVGEITASLDDTVGYGRIFEAEIKCNEPEVQSSYQRLKAFFEDLSLVPATQEELDKAFEKYLNSWRDVTAHLNERWITIDEPDATLSS